jgi:hypothetical protein
MGQRVPSSPVGHVPRPAAYSRRFISKKCWRHVSLARVERDAAVAAMDEDTARTAPRES